MSEINELPKGWLELPLSEVIRTQKGKKPKDLGDKSESRTVPYINIKAFEKKIITEYAPEQEVVKCNNDDILLVWDGARSGLSGRGISGYVGSTLARVRSDLVNVNFLSYFFESIYRILNTQTKGVGIPHINPVILNNLSFYLPPEAEQPRIVEKLDELFSELDAGIKELKAGQSKLYQYRQSLLKSAVEGTLTQKWRDDNKNSIEETGEQLLERILIERRERWLQQKLEEFKYKDKKLPKGWQDKYPEPVKPDFTDLPQLPEGWAWASLDQCTLQAKDITDGPFGSNLKTAHYTDSGPRVLRLQNIGDGVFSDDKAHISKEHYQTLLKHTVEANDILVAMMGELLPRSCSVPDGVAPAIVKADCARVRINTALLIPEIVQYYLNSNPIRNRTKSAVKGIGRPRINLGYIRSIAIPIPSAFEQKVLIEEIINQFDATDRQMKATVLGLKQADAQRKNILKSAFSGQLVQQDPNDEPASSLLDKIKAEREERSKITKPKRTKKKPTMKKTTRNELAKWISDYKDSSFTFEQIQKDFQGDYDQLKDCIFEMLSEKRASITQSFDPDIDSIKFIKEGK